MKSIGLMTFVRGSTNPADRMPGCANYDKHYGGCLGEDCRVETGRYCTHFEKVVLPTAGEKADKIARQYAKQVLKKVKVKKGRSCPECGGFILPRRKLCDDCIRKNKHQAYVKLRDKKKLVLVH